MLEGAGLARCPSCRETFSTERTGLQDCPACGKPLVVPEAAAGAGAASQPPGPEGAAPSGDEGTPWERRDQLGAWPAWRETVVQALFEPGRLFSSARLDRGGAQAGFAVLTASSFWIVGQLLDRFLLGAQRERLLNVVRARGLRCDGGGDQRVDAPGAAMSCLVRAGAPSVHALGLAAVAAILLAAAVVLPLDAPPLSLFACPFRGATGLPCLSCGCTHSFAA